MSVGQLERIAFGLHRVANLVRLAGSGPFDSLQFLDAARSLTGALQQTGVARTREVSAMVGDLEEAARWGEVDLPAARRFIASLETGGFGVGASETPIAAAQRLMQAARPARHPLGPMAYFFGGGGSLVQRIRHRAEAVRLDRIVSLLGHHERIPAYALSLKALARLQTPPPVILVHGTSLNKALSITDTGFKGFADLLFAVDADETWLDLYVYRRETVGVAGWIEFEVPFLDLLRFLGDTDLAHVQVWAGHVAVGVRGPIPELNRLLLGDRVRRSWVTTEQDDSDREGRGRFFAIGRETGQMGFRESLDQIPYPRRKWVAYGVGGLREELVSRAATQRAVTVRVQDLSVEELLTILLSPFARVGDEARDESLFKGEAFDVLLGRRPLPLDMILRLLPVDEIGFLPELLEKIGQREPRHYKEITEALLLAAREARGETRVNAVIALHTLRHPEAARWLTQGRDEGWIAAAEADALLEQARDQGPD